MSEKLFSLLHHAAPPKQRLVAGTPVLILLHGFGANEDDLFSLAPYVDERFLVISPRAPITLGPLSFAWFNLGFSSEGIMIDPREVEAARRQLRGFITEVVEGYGIDPAGVYLAGFSQGAMISLSLALLNPGLVAGVVAMSGRALPETITMVTDREAIRGLPILATHGTRDMVLPIHHGRETRQLLAELPVELTYHEYPMGHEISLDSLRDVTTWLTSQLDRHYPEIVN
jgi:phospholipase/carboxylesterase